MTDVFEKDRPSCCQSNTRLSGRTKRLVPCLKTTLYTTDSDHFNLSLIKWIIWQIFTEFTDTVNNSKKSDQKPVLYNA